MSDWLDRIDAMRKKNGSTARQGVDPVEEKHEKSVPAAKSENRGNGRNAHKDDWLDRIDSQRASSGRNGVLEDERGDWLADIRRKQEEEMLQRLRQDQLARLAAGMGPTMLPKEVTDTLQKYEQAQNYINQQTRSAWDLDFNVHRQISQGAIKAAKSAAGDRDYTQYAKYLKTAQRSINYLDQKNKKEYEAWIGENPHISYAEQMTVEELEQEIARLKAGGSTTHISASGATHGGAGGKIDDPAITREEKIAQLERAVAYRKEIDEYQAKVARVSEIENQVRSAADYEELRAEPNSFKEFYSRNISKKPETLLQYLTYEKRPDNDWAQMVAQKYWQMTDDQKAVFHYLWAKEDAEGAAVNGLRPSVQYMNTIPGLHEKYLQRQAEDAYLPQASDSIFEKGRKVLRYLTDSLGEGTTMAIEQGAGALDNIGRSNPRFSNYDTNSLLPIAMQRAGDGVGGEIYKTLGQAGQSVGRMIPSMAMGNYVGWLATMNPTAVAALGKVTHGAITAERAVKGAQNTVFYLTTKGSAMAEGREKGLSGTELEIYSNLCAISEVGLQNAIGGIAQFGGFSEKQLMSRIAQIDNVLLRTAARFGVQYGGELFEEELQNWMEPGFVTILTGDEYQAPTALEMLETALSTLFMVGSMNAGDTAQYYDSSKVRRNLQIIADDYRELGGEYEKAAQKLDAYIQAVDANPVARYVREDILDAMDIMRDAESRMEQLGITPEDIRDTIAPQDGTIEETNAERPKQEASGDDRLGADRNDEAAGTENAESLTARDGEPVPYGAQADSSTAWDGKPVPHGAQNDSEGTRVVYEQTKEETAEQARGLSDGELAAMAASVERNLAETRDSADPSEVAVMEGQLDALREEITAREAVNRNGERMKAAARAAEVPGVDWNDGSQYAEGGRPMTAPTETGRSDSSTPLRSAQNDTRAVEASGPYEGNGGLIARATEQEGLNNGTAAGEGFADGGQRDAGLGADRQAGGMGSRAEGSVARSTGAQERTQLLNSLRAYEAEKRSAQQIGVRGGTSNQNLIEVGEALYTSGMQKEKAEADARGERLTFFAGGPIEVRTRSGRIVRVDGLYQADADGVQHLFVRADSRRFTAEQLAGHEDMHAIFAENRGLLLDMVEALYEEQGEAGVARMVDAYVRALDGCYGVYEEGMSEDAQRELAMLYIEDMFADWKGGMNRSSQAARTAKDAAGSVAQRFAGDIENARQNRAGIDNRNGPGTRLSAEAKIITVESTDEERFNILAKQRLFPATVNAEQLKGIDLETFNTRKISSVQKGLQDIAEALGLFEIDLNNSYLDFPFGLSRRSFQSSLSHQLKYGGNYEDYVNMLSCFNDLVKNAHLIETHTEKKIGTAKENKDLKQSYVLLSAYQDDNSIVPVELLVKEFWNNNAGLYMVVTLTKIDSEVVATPAAGETGGAAKLFSESGYSLQDILRNVNPSDDSFLKYVPDGFLSKEQLAAKDRALKRQEQEYKSFGEAPKREHKQNLLENRVSGDKLLDAQDLIETLREVGAEVDERGYVTVYHRTTAENAARIQATGKMFAKEDGLFFSVNPEGQDNQGYGGTVVKLVIPAEKLVLDDIFADDASVRIPLGNKRRMDVSRFIVQQDNGQRFSAADEEDVGGVDWEGNREQRRSPSEDADTYYESVEQISPWEIVPRNDVEKGRMDEVRERAENTTEWQGRPILAYEMAESINAITGSHRIAVARLAGYDVDAVILRENELADIWRYLQDETYWDLDDFLERMDEADQADYLNKAVEKGYDSLREAASLMNAEVEGNDARYSRFSPSEDAGDSWGVDWIGKENGPQERDTTSSASRSEAPSPQGEGLETGERIATAPEAPRNDNEGNGGRSMSAPTEERGRQSAVHTEQSYAEQAREKKAEIAEKASIDGLKSRIKTAEERLKTYRDAEKMGLVTEAAKQHELQRRIVDTQETVDILKEALERKKAARTAEKADKAKRAEVRSRQKAEKLAAQKEAELRDNRPRQARKEFRQDALNLFSVPAAKREALGQALNRFADTVIAKGSVTEQDRRKLFTSLYEAGVETIQADEYYKNIRDFARGGRVYVPEGVRSEFGDDWDAFRKRAWGNGIYLTNDANDRGADAWNAELAEMFPGSFDAGETEARTMLENLVDLAEEGKAEHVSIEEMMLRNQQETGVSVDEQMDELERKVDALIDTFAQKAELEVKLRKAGTMQLVKERQKNREIAARQAQRKKENDTRNQVMKQLQDLNRMRKKSAPEIQRQIDEIIGNLDVMARSISPEGLENLQELARKYEEAAEDPNFLGNPYVEKRLARLEKTQLDSLEISDVIELGRIVSSLVKSVTEDKRLLTDAREREISDAAEAARKEILSSEGSKGGKLREFLGNEHLSPTRMIQRLGGWVRGGMMEQLSRALEDGGTRRMDYQRRATRIFDGFVADKENQEWLRKAQGKDAEWIKVKVPTSYVVGKDGKTGMGWTELEITPMMRVGLLMHSRNLDNLRHIQTGGIVIPNKAEYIKGNLAEADARGTRVKLQPETVRAIVKDCTAQERAFAALLEQYYDGFSKDKINEVSMQIDGFERAGGDHYYQIKVSRKFLAAQPEQVQKNMALDSIGSIVNERVHAGNPIILEDASAALTGHIDLISKYYGYTAAIRDFNAVMNYTFHEGAEHGGTANAFAGSVKETLGAKWGAGAGKYLDNLLADLQQKSSINETAAQIMAKLRGNLAAASLTLNPAVALSQTASLPGAVQVLGVDGVIAGLKPESVDMGLVEKYSPVLWYRNQGNSTQELGDYMATKGMGDKLPWWANWIQKMDAWTIRRLWAGAEYRVSKDTDLSPGSKEQIDAGEDAYYQEVARVFQRAVYDTQPNYSEMQRPAILRSKSDLTKALTMYKTVPLQYYNMMYEAVGRLRADAARAKADPSNKHYQAEFSKSKDFAVKTFAGILGANVTYVVMKALVKGLLGGKKDKYLDEEGKLDGGRIFGNLGKDLIDTYAGSVIFGSDLLSFGEKFVDAITTGKFSRYGGMEISFLSAIEDVMGGIYNLATELHDQDYRGGVGATKDLAKQLAMVCGIPANNAETYLLGITKLISPEWAARYENLFDEIERGDLKGQTGRDLRAAFRVLMDNRTDGLKDETVEELVRLWGNGQTVQVPSAVQTKVSIEGEDHTLTAGERAAFRESWGKIVSDNLEQLIGSEGYEQADDAGKAKLIKKLYDYARQQAVEAAVGQSPDAWVQFGKACVDAGINLEDYLNVAAVGKDKLKDMDGTELDAAIADRMRFRIGELDGDSLDELGRLWAAGATDVIPSDVPTSITVGGTEIKFSPEERVAWMQDWQRTAGESLTTVMGSKAYKAADDAGKEKLISAVYDYARAAASSGVTDNYTPDKWVLIGREAEARGIDAAEYILFHQQCKELKSVEKLDLLKKQGWTESQKEYIWMASMATEAQLTKYKPLKNSGVKWAAALDLMGVGEASTTGMTQEETERFQAAWDRISGPATKKLMANAAYKNADKPTQSAYIDKLNAYVTQTAKAETLKGYTIDKWVECGQKLSKAGVALDEYIVFTATTSDASNRDKYAALNKTGWTESQKLQTMAYISDSTHRVATVGKAYQVRLNYYLDALANADADQSGNINQEEAEAYIDRLNLGWEDKAYLWQMVCATSRWKNNPYSAGFGKEIWYDLHPNG